MPKASPERSRGRPAKLSRDQILSCALKLLQRSPGQKITMTGVAKALNTAPMSLYTHVQHRDDLMDGIADRVMGQLQLDIDTGADWETQVRQWLNRCYAHLSAYPQVVALLPQADRIPPSWLHLHAPLVATLRRAGLRGRPLANASQWVAHQLIGALVMGFARSHSAGARQEVSAMLELLDVDEREVFAEIAPHVLPDYEMFPYTVDQVVSSLRNTLAEQS